MLMLMMLTILLTRKVKALMTVIAAGRKVAIRLLREHHKLSRTDFQARYKSKTVDFEAGVELFATIWRVLQHNKHTLA